MDTVALQAYALIIEEGSFSAAARRLGISKSMCSKHISDIEARLGARLLTRSTRSVRPTAIGLDYYGKVRRILDLMAEADESVKAEVNTASGRLKIGAPLSYTNAVLQPHILRFCRNYPAIQLEMVLDDGIVDLIGQGYDAAIRVGELEDSALHARRIDSVSTFIVGAPAYLQEYGMPERPGDLAQHRALHYTNMRGAGTWPFRLGREVQHQKVHPAFMTNNGEMIRAAAVAGMGLAFMPEFLIRKDVEEGRLVSVLTEYEMPELPVNIVYPSRRNASAALRVLLDFAPRMEVR
ncbi:LysR family transcriptional regulator [Maritimibacter alkaliphilus]|uniref:LysR family transcriptional regulator n=1 Tax=Maritimibacter alkaliphilus TaxID=404236 RepID=UPI001C97750E|nr:LysR family transcriptional regulator [Maritimibacter alkaliphilus]MBY6090317.1 LysR family transcriptional regulator [Maritimibacter alkaliphilus]